MMANGLAETFLFLIKNTSIEEVFDSLPFKNLTFRPTRFLLSSSKTVKTSTSSFTTPMEFGIPFVYLTVLAYVRHSPCVTPVHC